MKIHPTAIISKEACLERGVEVGPYAIIGAGVKIAKGVRIGSFCDVKNDVTLGAGTQIFTGAVIGNVPQDLKYDGAKSSVVIGKNNIIREYVTINLSTQEGSRTIIGDNNLIMAYSHIAHDCVVGSHCIIANSGTLAGHVTLGDRVVVGGLVAIHQFVRLGTMSIVGGCSKVVMDIPPYSMCDGHPAKFYGLNLVGLKRAGVSKDAIHGLKAAYKIFFRSGLNKKHAVEKIKKSLPPSPEIGHLVEFISTSERGICH
ncbi:MAG: acyl-[acyl-carrier-protein]--UDP-N-acetylglucosamine O-acyltransferase [Candidatus Omnitrophica bacterium CG1_02_44_16]|nr:MAG: acyl-[acyl-carrier-protein]--UDP-N-acetylglucosamine O-acyltransferase [Candidatus Omnitrophica bacterium CG1_02_44_16]PIY82847.1 MAG: acyl-[acyl-carrier-protein]--UDP-N-acetylglucosamine O-acyltransferase [Candidatus Omnitrophica bacterium CG_4_10_14_0_8_um_filter_44_12]PIZ85129.1 MAG: acyl-[acyl-carrier-protein]--UDP-N-acetylglucosamine O-acyltransferase [Candidatus Omnitrophica bacterium CG_4_10_14_0_2_um_filter_44_9]